MAIKRVLLDLDGVLVDFNGSVQRLFGVRDIEVLDWSLEKYIGVSEKEMWSRIDEQGPYFWANLPRYPWYAELMATVLDYDFTIATTPSKDPYSAYGKRLWLQQNLGREFTNYMIGKQKWLMARQDTVLIDDKDDNCKAFEQHGGHAIVFPQPWNSRRDVARANLRMQYVKERLSEIGDGKIKDRNWIMRVSQTCEVGGC